MITNISLASVFVKDVDASKKFYVEVLGFDEGDDILLGDYRWCTVQHPSHPELQVHLTVPGPPFSPDLIASMNRAMDEGGLNGLGLATDDCRKTADELKAKGVEFVQDPTERPYGVEAVCRDNSGNWMVLVEAKPFDASTFSG